MTPERLQALNSQKHNLYTEFLPRGPNFTLSHYTTSRFQDKGCRNLEMPRMAPEWPFKHFTVKRVMNTLKIHPKTQISLFHSTTNHFQDIRLLKIGNALNDPKMILSM